MAGSAVFLLGAGFSAPFGIPTMMPFLRSFQAIAQRKYPEFYDTLQEHLSKLPSDGDIEALLSSLNSAERLKASLPPRMSVDKDLSRWENDSRFLKAHLISYIIEQCERFDRTRVSEILTPLIEELHKNATILDVHLFTTNYDRVIEHACEVGNIAFSDGFGTKLTAPRAFDSKLRLCKLHGSVTYYVDRHTAGKPVFWRLDRGYPLPGPDFRLTRNGHEIEPLMVLPTLEKEALGDPYGHLSHLFVDTMASARVVVAIGTSLRDSHLVSALRYSSSGIVLLVVDTEPAQAVSRISGVQCVTLRANAEDFLSVSRARLVDLFERCGTETDRNQVLSNVEEFAEQELREIARWKSMTEGQRKALAAIGAGGTEAVVLHSLRTLYGVSDTRAMEVVSKMCNPENSQSIRKATAACLGMSGNPGVVSALGTVASEDESADVRLEAYLALEEFNTDEARRALSDAGQRRPADAYFAGKQTGSL